MTTQRHCRRWLNDFFPQNSHPEVSPILMLEERMFQYMTKGFKNRSRSYCKCSLGRFRCTECFVKHVADPFAYFGWDIKFGFACTQKCVNESKKCVNVFLGSKVPT